MLLLEYKANASIRDTSNRLKGNRGTETYHPVSMSSCLVRWCCTDRQSWNFPKQKITSCHTAGCRDSDTE